MAIAWTQSGRNGVLNLRAYHHETIFYGTCSKTQIAQVKVTSIKHLENLTLRLVRKVPLNIIRRSKRWSKRCRHVVL